MSWVNSLPGNSAEEDVLGLGHRSSWTGNGELRLQPHKVVPQFVAKLVNITPISLWFMADITIVFMGFINQLITGTLPSGNLT